MIRRLSLLLLGLLVACSPAPLAVSTQEALLPSNTPAAMPQEAQAVTSGLQLAGRLLFVVRNELWIWRGDAGERMPILNGALQPAWSPDGGRIAFVQRGSGYSDLFMISAVDQQVTQLSFNGSNQPVGSVARIYDSRWAFYPAWSPDGQQLAYVAQAGAPFGDPAIEYNLTIYTTTLDGSRPVQRFADPLAHVGRLVYRDQGRLLLVYTPLSESEQQIYQLDLSTGNAEPLPNLPAPSYDPALSADRRWLAYAARDKQRTDIWLLDLNDASAQPRRLSSLGSARAPAFSPDGRLVAFLALSETGPGFELWVLELQQDATGDLRIGKPQQITQDLGIDADSGLSWAP